MGKTIDSRVLILACMWSGTAFSAPTSESVPFDNSWKDQKAFNSYDVPTARPLSANRLLNAARLANTGTVESVLGAHVDQAELESMPAFEAFVKAFEDGDELFEIDYNTLDGAGIRVGNGKRFTSIPRLDLDGEAQWANVLPRRVTGPNGTSCISCHNVPVADGAGGINDNVLRIDPKREQTGFIERQAPHLFGMGAVQLVAEEITSTLHLIRDQAIVETCASNTSKSVDLEAKGIDFGRLIVRCENINYRRLEGIDEDLVVKPFEWKGLTKSVRAFVRDASHQELGMQAVELVGDRDSDFDGVKDELSVGDITAMAIYNAAQPRPVTLLELNQVTPQLSDEELETYGLPLTASKIASITSGEEVFAKLECSSCHSPQLTVDAPVFFEPSMMESYRDSVFPGGADIKLPSVAIQFDLTSEILDNQILLASGQTLGQFERNANGGAIVRMYGDLKRHEMGRPLGEDIDEGNVGASVFLTENLWGVGSTAPYLHDGRATTLAEAIIYHGGDAKKSRDLFNAATKQEKRDLIAFLDNLVLYLDE